jgi:DNA polymerase (family 10)
MNNYSIADNFSLLAKLMDIHRENSFKAKTYSIAAYTVEKLAIELSTIEQNKIFSLKGIGESVGHKIVEQLQTGSLKILEEYLAKTPQGVLEMLHIKGIGPKKIATIWHDMEVENLGELLYACNENRLTLFKGFGEKTQQSVKDAIEFYMGTLGSYLYQQIENYTTAIGEKLNVIFPDSNFAITGAFRRQFEIIDKLEWVTTIDINKLKNFFSTNDFKIITEENGYISFVGKENVTLGFYSIDDAFFYNQLFVTSCSEIFLQSWIDHTGWDITQPYLTEEEIFEEADCSFIPPCLRENETIILAALKQKLPVIIQQQDVKGIIHSHSRWSDGMNSIEEMAAACIEQGYEYLVMSDHSKTASYAQGLPIEKVLAQHDLIDELNKKVAPFRVFKSIESDILGDGSLDYDADILSKFDVVIASIHSNLKMTEDKAMFRLMNAIENPYTSILGHMTGRLLLSRNGYPIDHKKIIDACAANDVVIELNAHPRRLDIDWRWINYALEKNVLISINPDAHSIDGFNDCKYGVLVAQKAGLTMEQNLSSFNLSQFENFLVRQHQKRA